jgi:MFS family permease
MGISTQQAGSLIALPAVWGAAATVGLSWLTERLATRGLRSRYSRGLVLGSTALFSGAMVLAGTMVEQPVLAIIFFMFGFGTAPAIFALTYLVVAETTTIGQRGAMLQYSNAILTSGGLLAPAIVGMLVGSASSAAVGYENAFVLTGAMMLGVGILSVLFINQQRDRKRLGLDV